MHRRCYLRHPHPCRTARGEDIGVYSDNCSKFGNGQVVLIQDVRVQLAKPLTAEMALKFLSVILEHTQFAMQRAVPLTQARQPVRWIVPSTTPP